MQSFSRKNWQNAHFSQFTRQTVKQVYIYIKKKALETAHWLKLEFHYTVYKKVKNVIQHIFTLMSCLRISLDLFKHITLKLN